MSNNQPVSEEKRSAEDRALDRFADMLISKIEGINGDWKKPWFTEGHSATWPKNLDGREYNGMNALVLMMHCEKEGYKLPVFMTFDRVSGLNYKGGHKTGGTQAMDKDGNPLPQVSVNKGEKSFPVFLTTFTVVDAETKEKIKYDDYKQLSAEERAKYMVFPKLNVYNVFNVSQTNIEQARPELFKKLQEANSVTRPIVEEGEQFMFPAIDHMIKHNEWICPIKPTYGDDAYYSISKAEIVIPEKRQFKSGESFYANLAHEMSHSTGAENQLNRLKPTSFGSREYAREELVAELSAALVSQRYGMDKCIKEDSVPYLKCWLDSLKEDPSFIKTVLTDVKKASAMIVEHVEKVQLVLDQEKGQVEGKKDEVKDQTVRQPDAKAAKGVVASDQKFAIICASTGGYVSQVARGTVRFDTLENAMHFDSRDEARAVARECKAYVPDLRFTVKPVEIEQNVENAASPVQSPLLNLGKFDIPEWSLNYLVNGEDSGLSDKEIALVDEFVKQFPNGFLMDVDWEDSNEFNHFPAFGERNENALPGRGEPALLATKTYGVTFFDPVRREENAHLSSRLSDLVVELRGEQRSPWLSGKVDGEPVVAEPLTPKEFKDYIDKSLSAEDLGLAHFKHYLDQTPEESIHSSRQL